MEPAKLKAATTYNAASDHFDDGPLAFWDRYGRGTIERLALYPARRCSTSVVEAAPRQFLPLKASVLTVTSSAWIWRSVCLQWHERKPPSKNSETSSFARATWKCLAFRTARSMRSFVYLPSSSFLTWPSKSGNCGEWYVRAGNSPSRPG